MGQAIFAQESAHPSAPTASQATLYGKTDGVFYYKDSAGVVRRIAVLGSTGTPGMASSVAGTNTITADIDATVTAYANGLAVWITPANNNSGATTLNLTPSGGAALGAKSVFSNGAACVGSELTAGVPSLLLYDGTQFNIVGGAQAVTLTNTVVLTNKTLTNEAHTVQALTDAATTNWDASLGAVATWGIAGNRTIAAPTNLKNGGFYVLRITQDATGGRIVTWNAVFKGIKGGAMPQPNKKASSVTTMFFESDGTNLYLQAPGGNGPLQINVVTATGTHTVPDGATRAKVYVKAAGGGGAAATVATVHGGGGGEGEERWGWVNVVPGTTVTVTLNNGGAGAGAGGTDGAGGGTSVWTDGTVTITASGGGGGSRGEFGGGAGGGGTGGSGGDYAMPGVPGQVGADATGGGVGMNAAGGGKGAGVNGQNGVANSGGGGGSGTVGNAAGAGGKGICVVEYYA